MRDAVFEMLTDLHLTVGVPAFANTVQQPVRNLTAQQLRTVRIAVNHNPSKGICTTCLEPATIGLNQLRAPNFGSRSYDLWWLRAQPIYRERPGETQRDKKDKPGTNFGAHILGASRTI